MKKNLSFAGIVTIFMLMTSGCTFVGLPNGRYLPVEDQGEYAIVYQDLIFLHMRAPEGSPGQTAFWDWGGSYSIGEGGKLELDMDNANKKLWNFYYNFRMQGGVIVVDDLNTRTAFPLRRERQKLRNEVMQFPGMQ